MASNNTDPCRGSVNFLRLMPNSSKKKSQTENGNKIYHAQQNIHFFYTLCSWVSLFVCTCPVSSVHIFAFLWGCHWLGKFGLYASFLVNSACLQSKKRKCPLPRNSRKGIPLLGFQENGECAVRYVCLVCLVSGCNRDSEN